MYVDLHVHSTLSDSSRTPEDIVETALRRNVSLLSVCDHYTIAAYARLEAACAGAGIGCVTGVEMDANLHGENYHVLAYNFDINNNAFLDFIGRQYKKSQLECEDMVERMSRHYPGVSVEDYRDYEPPKDTGGWKYIHYAVGRGVYATYYEAAREIYPRYFAPRPETLPVEDFCVAVKAAGGVPVLAHPGYVYKRDPDAFEGFMHEMRERGMGGIECHYPSHDKVIADACVSFCKQHDLRITAGSDCHGAYDESEGFTIGSLSITHGMLDLKGIC